MCYSLSSVQQLFNFDVFRDFKFSEVRFSMLIAPFNFYVEKADEDPQISKCLTVDRFRKKLHVSFLLFGSTCVRATVFLHRVPREQDE